MKTSLLAVGLSALFGSALYLGLHLGGSPAPAPATQATATAPVVISPASTAQVQGAPPNAQPTIPPQPTLADLRLAWSKARTPQELEPIAQALAEQSSAESVQVLLDGIGKIKEWPVRAALAKNLRAVSSTDALQALLPALLNNYGRGNTILNEISDAIARLAQSETVEDLSALHWQAAVQAGQGHKVLRTVACIRNPAAIHGLMKMAAHDDSPAMAAAAAEALKAMNVQVALR